ncbi:unnamed protein product, partial [Closterium sp. NIES-54]
MDADSSAGGKGRDDKETACSLVGVVEPIVSMAPEAGEEFQAMAAAVQANPEVVLLDSGCSHHLMGTKAAFVDLGLSGDVKHVCGFNGALQDVQGWGTVTLQGEAGKQNSVKLQEDGDGMLLVSAAGDVLGRASYTGRVLCANLRPCLKRSPTPPTEIVALRAIVSATKSTPDRLHARLAHVGMDTIRSSAKHKVATGLDLKSALGADSPCVRASAGSWRDTPSPTKAPTPPTCWPSCTSTWEFIGKQFTDFVDGKGIIHDLTCPYTPQQNGMAEWEMCTMVESVRTMLLHMGVQHHWWHLALRQAIWVRNCLERSALPPGTTPYQLFTGTNPNLSMARVWGCMAQFLVPEQQRGGKLKPKARWGL